MGMGTRKPRAVFSTGWMIASIVAFSAMEVLIGGYIGPAIAGRWVSHVFMLRLEVMLVLSSYLVGGFLIGFFSPTVRVFEPIAGAFIAAVLPFLIGILSPSRFYLASTQRLCMAGALAGFIAYVGADAGERLCGMLGNSASAAYSEED